MGHPYELCKKNRIIAEKLLKKQSFLDAASHFSLALEAAKEWESQLSGADQSAIAKREQKAIQSKLAWTYELRGDQLANAGSWEEAHSNYENAITHERHTPGLYQKTGRVLNELGQFDGAITAFLNSLQIDPNQDEPNRFLGDIYGLHLRDVHKAIQYYTRYIELKNTNPLVYFVLADLVFKVGNIESAIEYCVKALSLKPDFLDAINLLLLAILRIDTLSPAQIKSYKTTWITSYLNEIRWGSDQCFSHPKGSGAKRKLHIGYLSNDFYDHVVTTFFLPLLTAHNRDKFSVSVYSYSAKTDSITEKIEENCDQFRPVSGLSQKR